MISFSLCGVRFRFYFDFFFVSVLVILLSGIRSEYALLACALHEAGHIAAMRCFGVRIREIDFRAYGIKISPEKGRLIPVWEEAAVLSAGCAVNFILFIIFRDTYFGAVNLCLAVFNILPAGELDGGRLAKCAAEYFFPCSAKTEAVSKAFSVLCAAGLSLFFAFGHYANLSVFSALAFILVSAM